MQFLKKALDVAYGAAVAVMAVVLMCFVLYALAPAGPAITLFLVGLGTLYGLQQRTAAILTLGGLLLYAASWPAVQVWGLYWGMGVWLLGFSSWMVGVFRPFPCLQESRTF